MLRRTQRSSGRGFALVAVLWVLVGVAVLGASLTSATRETVAAAQNRVDLLRAAWRAEACAEGARSVIDEALTSSGAKAWLGLDAFVSRSPVVTGCDLSLRPGGTRLDINSTDSLRVRAVLTSIALSADRADSLVDAVMDWRDPDDASRPHGAEKAWYVSRHLPTPRNGEIAAIEELRFVRGFDQIDGLDSLFGVDDERIVIDRAPVAVLASLPGFGTEALALVADRRSRGAIVGDLSTLAAALSPASRSALLAHYPELVRLTTATPDAWTLVSRGAVGSPAIVATLELRLVNAGTRAAIVRRRSWP